MKRPLQLLALAILLTLNPGSAEEQLPEYDFIWEGAPVNTPENAEIEITANSAESNSTSGEIEFSGNVSITITTDGKSLRIATDKIIARPKTALSKPIDFHCLMLEQNPQLRKPKQQ